MTNWENRFSSKCMSSLSVHEQCQQSHPPRSNLEFGMWLSSLRPPGMRIFLVLKLLVNCHLSLLCLARGLSNIGCENSSVLGI